MSATAAAASTRTRCLEAPRGRSGTASRVLYRLDASYEDSDGWRDAGADRLNVSPSLTWIMGENARMTIHQTFNRDRFDGDGGVPLNIIDLPSLQARPSLQPAAGQGAGGGFADARPVQRQHLLGWEFRNAFLGQRTSDRYFVTEGLYGDPDNNLVFREPLDFHHIRRPIQNQAELLGQLDGFGRHNLLFGYEYQRDKYRSEVTAGDDPDCLCGYWWLTIAPMDITTMEETQTAARYRHGRTHDIRQRSRSRLLLAGPDRRAAPAEDQRRGTSRRLQAPHHQDRGLAVHASGAGPDGVLLPGRPRVRAAGRPAALLQHGKLVYSGHGHS